MITTLLSLFLALTAAAPTDIDSFISNDYADAWNTHNPFSFRRILHQDASIIEQVLEHFDPQAKKTVEVRKVEAIKKDILYKVEELHKNISPAGFYYEVTIFTELRLKHTKKGYLLKSRKVLSHQTNKLNTDLQTALGELVLKNHDKVLELIQPHEKTAPGYHMADIHYLKGVVHKEKKQYKEAAAALKAAIKLHPDFISALNNLAEIALLQGRYEEAAAYLQQSLKIKPEQKEARGLLLQLGIIIDNKLQASLTAVSLNPFTTPYSTAIDKIVSSDDLSKQRGFKILLGFLYIQMSQYEHALKTFMEVLYFSPDDATVLFLVSRLYFLIGNYDSCVDTALQVKGVTLLTADTILMVARAMERAGKFNEAISFYRKYLPHSWSKGDIHMVLATLYRKLEDINMWKKHLMLAQKFPMSSASARKINKLIKDGEL